MDKTWTDHELEELARQHGYEVSARQLERWHKADVLPRPVQDARVPKGTRSFYPPGTDAFLLAACRLRSEGKGRPLWRLRFELWWEGHAIPLDKVRASLVALLDPVHALLDDAEALEHTLDELPRLEEEQTRRGLPAHVRQALRRRPYEAVDLMALILDLLAREEREVEEPIDHARSERTFADALADVLAFNGTRKSGAEHATIFGEGAAEALAEATSVARRDPASMLARIDDERLLAARDAAQVLHTALPVVADVHRRLKGQDLAGLRLVRQAGPVAASPVARAQLVMLCASSPAFDAALLKERAARAAADERRYGAMQRVLEVIPESRILEEGIEAFDALPTTEREALATRIKAFLEARPDVAATWEDK
jgi:hypothetical protein